MHMLLLGAGASKDAGLPDSRGMTSAILSKFEGSDPGTARILRFVIGGLLFKAGIRNQNPLDVGVNVEDLFNAVQLLAGRNELEAAPFIGSWHALVDKFDQLQPDRNSTHLHRAIYKSVSNQVIKALSATPPAMGDKDIDRNLQQQVSGMIDSAIHKRGAHSSAFNSVGRAVAEYMKKLTDTWKGKLEDVPSSHDFDRAFRAIDQRPKPAGGRVFARVNQRMIRALAEIVWLPEAASVEYLAPILQCVRSQERLVVATLNYDNAIERLVEREHGKLRCSTGIDEWAQTGGFEVPDAEILLLKLHGSIDWALDRNATSDGKIPQALIRRVTEDQIQQPGFMPAVIFGQRNKLTAEGPFLDLLRAFQRELAKCVVLTVVGYSFCDEHVNVFIAQWLNQAPNHRLRIISKSFENSAAPFAKTLREYASAQIDIVDEWAAEGLARAFPPDSKQIVLTEGPFND